MTEKDAQEMAQALAWAVVRVVLRPAHEHLVSADRASMGALDRARLQDAIQAGGEIIDLVLLAIARAGGLASPLALREDSKCN